MWLKVGRSSRRQRIASTRRIQYCLKTCPSSQIHYVQTYSKRTGKSESHSDREEEENWRHLFRLPSTLLWIKRAQSRIEIKLVSSIGPQRILMSTRGNNNTVVLWHERTVRQLSVLLLLLALAVIRRRTTDRQRYEVYLSQAVRDSTILSRAVLAYQKGIKMIFPILCYIWMDLSRGFVPYHRRIARVWVVRSKNSLLNIPLSTWSSSGATS